MHEWFRKSGSYNHAKISKIKALSWLTWTLRNRVFLMVSKPSSPHPPLVIRALDRMKRMGRDEKFGTICIETIVFLFYHFDFLTTHERDRDLNFHEPHHQWLEGKK
ncbi:hypothetical protein TNIN_212841 [Trichonephila inaurata madagascariensis]|uniref:Uncharacterized protein n=1 Tax=Trichonephila inaurata madagascariensis TaxID=2747483 RepID=A0A8X6WVI1_9ARAC|nr:hypothetical protein TNIN_212841 [Trichonephila inaurata madagascariensis]